MNLSTKLKEEILTYAKACAPEEMCGVIHVVKGRRRFYPCKNLAETRSEHFILDSEDFAKAEDLGEVIAVVHSHIFCSAEPSIADRVGCNKSELPWLIVNPYTETWDCCEPDGFELPYVGREFVFGIVDCYTLVRDWYKRELGIELDDFSRRDRFWERGENLYVDNYKLQGFHKVPFEEMQYGDAILMQLTADLPNHAAIYLGDQFMLHHLQDRLSSRDVYGGYYVKSTAMVLRHESR